MPVTRGQVDLDGRRVAITGLGCVCGLGQGVEATWSALLAGRGAIRHLSRRAADDDAYAYEGPAAWIEALDPAPLGSRFGARPFAAFDPLAAYALVATQEALDDAGLIDHPVLGERTAVIYGAGSGGNATIEQAYDRLFNRRTFALHPQSVPRQMLSAPVSAISMGYGVRGPAFSVASACASSGHAIAEGMHMIRAGRADVAIVGGAEAAITYGSWAAWTALRAMAQDTCRPFSQGRAGMVLGEGAATVVLESFAHARARGARIHGELAGAGASSDAAHLTAPNGVGAVAALRIAHEDAGLALDEPLLYSAHGTGTLINDRMEAAALREVYGAALGANLVIATKSAHGHLIGGAGALELLIGVLAINRRTAPAILNFLGSDEECAAPLALEAIPIDYDAVVSSSFAFGGLNAVLIARSAHVTAI